MRLSPVQKMVHLVALAMPHCAQMDAQYRKSSRKLNTLNAFFEHKPVHNSYVFSGSNFTNAFPSTTHHSRAESGTAVNVPFPARTDALTTHVSEIGAEANASGFNYTIAVDSDVKGEASAKKISPVPGAVCGGAKGSLLPWRSDSVIAARQQQGSSADSGYSSKRDLMLCMKDQDSCGTNAGRFARSLTGVKKLHSLPAISFAGQSKVSSCAVVGNAGFMLQKHYGSFIDSHDLVVRFNILKTDKFRKFVGRKTTFRFLNHARSFGVCARKNQLLPEGREIIAHGRPRHLKALVLWHPNEREKAQACLSSKYKGVVQTHSISPKLSAEMVKSMSELRADISRLGLGKGMKSSMPSELTSGAQAVLLLLRMCNKVSVYGISSYKPVTPNGKGYQYGGRQELRVSGDKFHDWILESNVWRLLHAAGYISICSV